MSINAAAEWKWQLPTPVLQAGITGQSADTAMLQAKAVATVLASGLTMGHLGGVVDAAYSHSDNAVGNAPTTPQVACKKGCAWCCYMNVEVSAPEVFRLAEYLREALSPVDLESLLSRLKTACHYAERVSPSEYVLSKHPCPLLDIDTNTCIAYLYRPFACRAWNSTDASGCEQATRQPNVTTPNNIEQMIAARAVAYGLHVGLSMVSTLPLDVYDLNGALLIALEDEHIATRWIRGESVFPPDVTVHKAHSIPLPVIEVRQPGS